MNVAKVKPEIKYRPAIKDDVPTLLWLIQLFAEELKGDHAHSVKIRENDLISDGFSEEPYFWVILAELTSPPPSNSAASPSPPLPSASMKSNDSVIGYALYFFLYSTWAGGCLLCMEDLYIRPDYRNKGIGTSLMRETAKIAETKNCTRMIWDVRDWNTRAMDLYKRLGGKMDPDLLDMKLDRPSLYRLAPSSENNGTEIHFRQATEQDIDVVFGLVQEILEHFNDSLQFEKKDFLRDGFGQRPYFKVILVELTSPNPSPSTSLPLSASKEAAIGYCLYCYTYSPWEGHVLCIEDIYIRRQYRSKGYGTLLMKEIARIAKDRGCARIIWQVLQSNTSAKIFYERLGAKFVPELLNLHMERPDLIKFANSDLP